MKGIMIVLLLLALYAQTIVAADYGSAGSENQDLGDFNIIAEQTIFVNETTGESVEKEQREYKKYEHAPTRKRTPAPLPTITVEITPEPAVTEMPATPAPTDEVTPLPTIIATPVADETPEITPSPTPQPAQTPVPAPTVAPTPVPQPTAAATPMPAPVELPLGGGGGGCGRDVTSKEKNLTNIDHRETREYWVERNRTTEYKFTTIGFIKKAGFYANTSEGCISIQVEVLKGKPTGVDKDVSIDAFDASDNASYDGSGDIFYFNVWAGPLGYINSRKAHEPFIVFAGVPDELKRYEAVKLMYFENGFWTELEEFDVALLEENFTRVGTPGFGNFAFVGFDREIAVVTPVPTVVTPVVKETPAPKEITDYLAMIAIILIILGMIILFLLGHFRGPRQKKLTDFGGGDFTANILSERWLSLRKKIRKIKARLGIVRTGKF